MRPAESAAPSETPARRTMRMSILEGLFQAMMVGAGESFFVPYALHLGAGNALLGLMVAVPVFAGSLIQLFTERALHLAGTRLRLMMIGASFQALIFVPLLMLPLMPVAMRLPLLLVLVAGYQAAGLVIGPAWNSLIGDVVPENGRGAYFSRRNRYLQVASFIALPAAGGIMSLFQSRGAEPVGFLVIFLIAGCARAVSLVFLAMHWEPPMQSMPTPRTFSIITETLRKPDWRALVFYIGLMTLAVNLSAPYFTAYMLRPREEMGLGWSYLTFTAVNTITVLTKWLFLPVWGMATDRFGARRCLVLAAWLVSTLPLFWLFPADRPWLHLAVIVFAQAWGGFAWAGHELSWFHFLLDAAPGNLRPRLVASVNMLNGLMNFAGSSIGALMMATVPRGTSAFFFIFGLSTVLRFGVCGALLGHLREVRLAERISYTSLFFRLSTMRSQAGFGLRFFVFPSRRGGARESGSRGPGGSR